MSGALSCAKENFLEKNLYNDQPPRKNIALAKKKGVFKYPVLPAINLSWATISGSIQIKRWFKWSDDKNKITKLFGLFLMAIAIKFLFEYLKI